MTYRDPDSQILEALSAARRQHPELTDLLAFYHDLYQVQFRVKATLPAPTFRDRAEMQACLDAGTRQLEFDHLPLQPAAFASLVAEIAQVLLRHNPAWQPEEPAPGPEQLIARARHAFDTWETLTPSQDKPRDDEAIAWQQHPLAAAVSLALAPYLQRAAEAILPHLDLVGWSRGTCPICGGRPNLALLESKRGARRLLCSRCDVLWEHPRVGCPFCHSREKQVFFASPDGVYRLYTCPSCRRYLKTVDLRELHRKVLPAVERLLTVSIDLTARQEGYRD